MALSVKQFTKHLTNSGVMSREDITAFVETLPLPPEDGQQLAKLLIQKRKLTKFQAQRVYQGKYKGLVLGNYHILDTIGAGGMGQVYLAEHSRMGRRVALKTLPPAVARDEATLKRFHREVRAAAKLDHANIVTAFDADEANGIHFLVMEHVEGTDLSQLVKQNGQVSLEQALDYVLQTAQGLKYAHDQGIVHRDIKPSNLLVNPDGRIKILDMGLARIDAEAEGEAATALTTTGTMMGTMDYMAPEQAMDTHQADGRSDIYSLGCVLYYLLTGRPVFEGDTALKKILAHREEPVPSLTDRRDDIPENVDLIFQNMLTKNPDERYQTMNEVIAELENCGVNAVAATVTHAPAITEEDSNLRSFLASLEEASTPTVVQPAEPPSDESDVETVPSGVLQETLVGGIGEAKGGDGKPPRNRQRLWMMSGGLFGLILLLGIIIKVTNPDGTETKIEVPDGSAVKIEEDGQVVGNFGTGAKPSSHTGQETNYALQFDGKGSQVVIEHDYEQIQPLTIEVTVSVPWAGEAGDKERWEDIFRFSSKDSEIHCYLKHNPESGTVLECGANYSGPLRFKIDSERKFQIAVVCDNSMIRLFKNGVFIGEKRIEKRELPIGARRTEKLILGGQDETKNYLSGTIDELRISNLPRYRQDYKPKERLEAKPGTIALYHFDEGQGDVLKDSSGNGHHGKIHGAKWVKVDDDLKVIEDTPAKSSPSFYETDPHRAAAGRVLELGGTVKLWTSRTGETIAKTINELPETRFAVRNIVLNGCDQISVDDMRLVGSLGTVETLMLGGGSSVTDAHVAAFDHWDSVQLILLDNTSVSDAAVESFISAKNLRTISLGATQITDKACESLANITSLRNVHIPETEITDTGLKALSQLPNLRMLRMPNCSNITEAGLAHFASARNLQLLELNQNKHLDDDIVPALSQLETLRHMDLRDTELTNAGIATLHESLPNSNIEHSSVMTPVADRRVAQWALKNGINVSVSPMDQRITELPDDAFFVQRLFRNSEAKPVSELPDSLEDLKSLESLQLAALQDADEAAKMISQLDSLRELGLKFSGVTGPGLERLSKLTQLELLYLNYCENVNDDALSLLAAFPHMSLLNVATTNVTDKGLMHLKSLLSISHLNISGTRTLTGTGLKHLIELPNLSVLFLESTSLTDEAALPHLKQMQQLRILNIMGTKITPQGAAELQAALPNCVVFHESLENTPWTAPASHNYALSFDGEDDYVELPELEFEPKSPLTFEAWVKNEGPSFSFIVGSPASSLRLVNDKWVFFRGTQSSGQIARAIHQDATSKKEYIHLAGVWDGERNALFVEGVLQDTITPDRSLGIGIGTHFFGIGGNVKGGNLFKGLIDEVRISNIARYENDFTPEKRFEADEHTLALYHFDEGQGDVLKDSSGNGHHGKIDGATWVKADGTPIEAK